MPETTDASVVWLTQTQQDELQAELDYLTGPGRSEISKKIEAARAEGDAALAPLVEREVCRVNLRVR